MTMVHLYILKNERNKHHRQRPASRKQEVKRRKGKKRKDLKDTLGLGINEIHNAHIASLTSKTRSSNLAKLESLDMITVNIRKR